MESAHQLSFGRDCNNRAEVSSFHSMHCSFSNPSGLQSLWWSSGRGNCSDSSSLCCSTDPSTEARLVWSSELTISRGAGLICRQHIKAGREVSQRMLAMRNAVGVWQLREGWREGKGRSPSSSRIDGRCSCSTEQRNSWGVERKTTIGEREREPYP